jgi:hypothetical protein
MGESMTVRPSGGVVGHHFITDTNDDHPRPGETGTFYAQWVDIGNHPVPQAGVTANWTLTQNGTTLSAGATLGAATSLTDAAGVATVTVAYDSGAGATDYYQAEATP